MLILGKTVPYWQIKGLEGWSLYNIEAGGFEHRSPLRTRPMRYRQVFSPNGPQETCLPTSESRS